MMKVDQAKNAYLSELEISGLAVGTIACRRIYLDGFISFLYKNHVYQLSEITPEVIWQYHCHLFKSHYAPTTRNNILSVLCLFLCWIYENEYMFLDLSLCVQFPSLGWNIQKLILSEHEMKYLLSLPDVKTYKGIRDRAIMELFYSTGIRLSELISLLLYDLNRDEASLKVLGKGNKERLVPVGKKALYWLNRYFNDVRAKTKVRAPHLFLDLVAGTQLSPGSVSFIIREYGRASKLKKKITAHKFRHACATHLLKNGADIRYIQQLLGHESCETTQIYTTVEISDLQDVFRKTHPRAKI